MGVSCLKRKVCQPVFSQLRGACYEKPGRMTTALSGRISPGGKNEKGV
jgi:hypothetical protein